MKMFRIWVSVFFVILLFVLASCKTDEFKFGDLTVKDDFTTDLMAPVFSGNLEFRDFINWEKYVGGVIKDTISVLDFLQENYVKIPRKIVFDQNVIVKDFPFSIQGNYELTKIALVFNVNNGTAFPLNMKLRFFEKTRPTFLGPSIQPDAFDAGEVSGMYVFPVASTDTLLLSEEQRQSFINGNRIQITTWFNKAEYINEYDTLNARFPVDIAVVMLGKVKAGNEDN